MFQDFERLLTEGYTSFRKYIEEADFEISPSVFREFNRFRILCSTRSGRRGVEYINTYIEQRIIAANDFSDTWYPGRWRVESVV